ncbi:MAG: HEAT repeat domain-containing protein [Planctomycetota bacterium]
MNHNNSSDDAPVIANASVNSIEEVLVADAALAAQIVILLKKQDIPCVEKPAPNGRGKLVIPAEFAMQAVQAIAKTPGLVFESAGEPHIRRFDPERDQTILDHPVLKQTPADHKRRGTVAIDELMECVTRGSEPVAKRAVFYLARIGADAHPALDKLFIRGIETGNTGFVTLMIREGKVCESRGSDVLPAGLRTLLHLSKRAEENVRLLAIRALGALRAREGIVALADALLDESADVAIEADDAFLNWGAADEQFEPDLPLDKKRAIASNRKNFKPK